MALRLHFILGMAGLALLGCAKLQTALPFSPKAQTQATLQLPAGKAAIVARQSTTGFHAVFTARDQRGDVTTWVNADGRLLSFRDGMLIETRGFDADLMSSSMPKLAQIRQRTSYTREYFVTARDDQVEHLRFICKSEALGRHKITLGKREAMAEQIRETCRGDMGSFANYFWFEGSNLRKSQEWIGPDAGWLEFERIIE